MDFIFTMGMLGIIFSFIYIYMKNNSYVFMMITAGIFLILLGIPFVTGQTFEYQHCDYVISNITTSGDTDIYYYSLSCDYNDITAYWKLQEAFGILFMLSGLGIILSIHQDWNISRER